MKTHKLLQIVVGIAVIGAALFASTGCNKPQAPADTASQSAAEPTQSVAVVVTEPATAAPASGSWARFGPKPGGKSKVRIEGDSTMHAWRVESPLVGGFVEVGPNFPLTVEAAKPGKLDAKVEVFIPVKSLKSLEADGKPYSTRMDDVMYGKLLEPQHKRIMYRLTELTLKEVAKSADAPHVCEAAGELVVAGATNKITMPVNVLVSADKKVRISGSLASKMTDFKIQPPELTVLGMGIKTDDNIKLIFEWEVGPQEAPKAQ